MENSQDTKKLLAQDIESLPYEVQKGMNWLIQNIQFVDQIIQSSKLSNAKMKQYLKDAEQRQDYITWCVIKYWKINSKQQVNKGVEP